MVEGQVTLCRCDESAWVWVALVVSGLTVACASGPPPRGYALYPNAAQAQPRSEVSQVLGVIHAIDGKDVENLGTNFELFPGCHIVEVIPTAKSTTYVTAYAVNPRPIPFAIFMTKGHSYYLEHDYIEQMGNVRLVVGGKELDAQGNEVRNLEPAHSQADVERCMKGG